MSNCRKTCIRPEEFDSTIHTLISVHATEAACLLACECADSSTSGQSSSVQSSSSLSSLQSSSSVQSSSSLSSLQSSSSSVQSSSSLSSLQSSSSSSSSSSLRSSSSSSLRSSSSSSLRSSSSSGSLDTCSIGFGIPGTIDGGIGVFSYAATPVAQFANPTVAVDPVNLMRPGRTLTLTAKVENTGLLQELIAARQPNTTGVRVTLYGLGGLSFLPNAAPYVLGSTTLYGATAGLPATPVIWPVWLPGPPRPRRLSRTLTWSITDTRDARGSDLAAYADLANQALPLDSFWIYEPSAYWWRSYLNFTTLQTTLTYADMLEIIGLTQTQAAALVTQCEQQEPLQDQCKYFYRFQFGLEYYCNNFLTSVSFVNVKIDAPPIQVQGEPVYMRLDVPR